MTQHYEPATWFLTLSPSEWLWDELGEYIREVNGWSDIMILLYPLVFLLLEILCQHRDFLTINFGQCLILFVLKITRLEK